MPDAIQFEPPEKNPIMYAGETTGTVAPCASCGGRTQWVKDGVYICSDECVRMFEAIGLTNEIVDETIKEEVKND
jgi:hypothetical protein